MKKDLAQKLAEVLDCDWLELMDEPRDDLARRIAALSEEDRAFVVRLLDTLTTPPAR